MQPQMFCGREFPQVRHLDLGLEEQRMLEGLEQVFRVRRGWVVKCFMGKQEDFELHAVWGQGGQG